jgi:light-regulated signal transduction histidine kinase (bacteriophytochrome)
VIDEEIDQEAETDLLEARLLRALCDDQALARDILRERHDLQARVASLTEELAGLVYSVSHDLGAPVRHLEGFSRILVEDVEDLDPQIKHEARRIQEASTRLRQMVSGMLLLSRLGQAEVHLQPVDLAQLGREVAAALASVPDPQTGPPRAGAVQFVAPESLPVMGDARLLLTLLQELLGNAWKFTFRTPAPRVELGVCPPEQGEGPVYFIGDNGAGFEPACADRLFGVFQRLHSAEDFPGIGIGLASAKRIVTKHGGTVRATGTLTAGATVFFTLPS